MTTNDQLPVKLVTYTGSFNDEIASRKATTWGALAKFLATPREKATKEQATGWSPCEYRPDAQRRGASGPTRFYAAVVDLDDVPLAKAKERLAGLEYAVHSTWSHNAPNKGPRYRVVLPLAEPIDAKDWPAAQAHLQELLPQLDKASTDTSRFFYAPSVRPGQPYEFEHARGKLLRLSTEPTPAMRAAAEKYAAAREARAARLAAGGEVETLEDYLIRREVVYERFESDGKERYAVECPWIDDHTSANNDRDAACWEGPEGQWSFRCFHAHCAERGFKDFSAHLRGFETPYEEQEPDFTPIDPMDAELAELVSEGPRDGDSPEGPREYNSLEPVELEPFDAESLPQTPWLIPGVAMREELTVIAARGGSGKSTLALQLAVAVATGQAFAHWEPAAPGRVLILNGEDRLDEQRRRLAAVRRSMGIIPGDTAGRLSILPPGDFALLERRGDRFAAPERTPFFDALSALVAARQYDLLVLDPAIRLGRGLIENSNEDMNLLALALAELAQRHRIPVLVVHHAKKGADGSADSSRGGSSLTDAARILVTLSTMTPKEADKLLSIDKRKEHWRYVKVSGAKSNYSERGSDRWLMLDSADVGNGDTRGVLVPWAIGSAATKHSLDAALWELHNCSRIPGHRYSTALFGRTSKRRADCMLVEMLGVSLPEVHRMLQDLIADKRVVETEYRDDHRKPIKCFGLSDAEAARLDSWSRSSGQLEDDPGEADE